MKKYQRKPPVVNAFQYKEGSELPKGVTKEQIQPGDYIIVTGNLNYPIDEKTFLSMYEEVPNAKTK